MNLEFSNIAFGSKPRIGILSYKYGLDPGMRRIALEIEYQITCDLGNGVQKAISNGVLTIPFRKKDKANGQVPMTLDDFGISFEKSNKDEYEKMNLVLSSLQDAFEIGVNCSEKLVQMIMLANPTISPENQFKITK